MDAGGNWSCSGLSCRPGLARSMERESGASTVANGARANERRTFQETGSPSNKRIWGVCYASLVPVSHLLATYVPAVLAKPCVYLLEGYYLHDSRKSLVSSGWKCADSVHSLCSSASHFGERLPVSRACRIKCSPFSCYLLSSPTSSNR